VCLFVLPLIARFLLILGSDVYIAERVDLSLRGLEQTRQGRR
jgi:hypothetical protein